MRRLAWFAAVSAMAYGCSAEQQEPPGSGESGDEIGAQASEPQGVVVGAPAPAAACDTTAAPGDVLESVQLPPLTILGSLSADAAGGVAYTTRVAVGMNPDSSTIYAFGVARLDADLNHVYDYFHGSAVALDAAGNAYVAGGFTEPTDFGTGVITPQGNIDAFVVKLSPTGEVLAVHDLEDCGADVGDIAVAADGRVAISGSEMGTVVLDANGDVQLREDVVGKLAFDAAGNLVVAGSYTGELGLGTSLATTGADDANGFVVKLDTDGDVVFAHQFSDAALPVTVGGYNGFVDVTEPTAQAIGDVAVDANGNIGVIGNFYRQMELGGLTLRNGAENPSGTQLGAFVAKLDGAGNLLYGVQQPAVKDGLVRNGGIVMNAAGDIIVSTNQPGNAQPPFAYPQLSAFDATGAVTLNLGNGTGISGYGLGVAMDACGNILAADLHNEPSVFDAHDFLSRIAL